MTDIYTSVAITGITPTVLDYRLRLYLSQINEGSGNWRTDIYNDAALTSKVGYTATYTATAGAKTVLPYASSGLGGTVTVNDLYARTGVVVHYGRWSQVGALTSSLLTVVGRPLDDTGGTATVPYLWYSPDPHRIQVHPFGLPGAYAGATEADAIRDIGKQQTRWDMSSAHMACFRFSSDAVGTEGARINMYVDSTLVCPKNSGEGWPVTAARTWYCATDLTEGVGVLEFGSTIEAAVTLVGSADTGYTDLTIHVVAVLE